MAQHGWAAFSKMSATSAAAARVGVGGLGGGTGGDQIDQAGGRVAGRPARRAAAALCRRVRRRPVTGRARICTQADSPSPMPSRAPRSGRSGSTLCSVRSGYCSGRARRSSPPVATPPPASGGVAGSGLGAGTGPGGLDGPLDQAGRDAPGTHQPMASPASVAVSSKPRCGWPPSARRHAGRSSATRLVHKVAAPWGSTSGGASTRTRRAPSARRRAWRRRMTVTVTAATRAIPARTGPAVAAEMGGQVRRGDGAAGRSRRQGGRGSGRGALSGVGPVGRPGLWCDGGRLRGGHAHSACASCWSVARGRGCRRGPARCRSGTPSSSAGLARAVKATRSTPAARRPWPRPRRGGRRARRPRGRTPRRGCRWTGALGGAGSGWRRWRPPLGRVVQPRRSPASWVTTVSPAQCLRADLAMRNRNSAPDGSRHQQPGLVDDHQPALAVRRVGHTPPDGVEGEQRPCRLELVGQVAEAEDDEVAVGAGGGRTVEQSPVGAGHERCQPGGQRPGGGVAIGVQRGGEVPEQRCGAGVAAGVGVIPTDS